MDLGFGVLLVAARFCPNKSIFDAREALSAGGF